MAEVHVKDCVIGSGMPKICVPIVARTMSEIFSQARASNSRSFDITEWRVDWFEDYNDLHEVRRAARVLRGILGDRPILFTFRTKGEGGSEKIDMDYYVKLHEVAISEHLADMIDVELFAGDEIVNRIVSAAHEAGLPVIISSHDFEQTPPEDELIDRMKRAEALGADILKLAVMPHTSRDVLTLLSATERMSRQTECPLVTMSMGRLGTISRLSGEIFGSSMTFGTVGFSSAPGQVSLDSMQRILQLLHK